MRARLLSRKSVLLIAVVISLIGASVAVVPHWGTDAVAQDGFSNASVSGTYAFVTAGGSPTEGTIGVLVADGNGNVTGGTLILNVPRDVLVPGAEGRTQLPAQVASGTYAINADGTGTVSATASIPGQTLVRNFDLVISGTDGSLATECTLSQIEPTLGGGLGFFAIKRIGD